MSEPKRKLKLNPQYPSDTKMTFCINTSKNEKHYLELLLQSLLNGIDVNLHDIIIFIDSDNQDTAGMLKQQKHLFPNMIIIKNTGEPIGYSSNINFMFQYAKTEIVSYLQSDNVVCLGYDKAILKHFSSNYVLSSLRVEPPLHALSDNDITLVENCGLTPDTFDYEKFLTFAELQKQKSQAGYLTDYFFAPFTVKRDNWLNMGGFDVSFKKSREDSDFAIRVCLMRGELKQTWEAIVYHFTCTSSRCPEWWKEENKHKEPLRLENDRIELNRFVKKWGVFIHPRTMKDFWQYHIGRKAENMEKVKVINPPIDDAKFVLI